MVELCVVEVFLILPGPLAAIAALYQSNLLLLSVLDEVFYR